MEQWEIDYRKKAESIIQEGMYNIPGTRVNKANYIEHQVKKEKRHRKLIEDEKNGIKENPNMHLFFF